MNEDYQSSSDNSLLGLFATLFLSLLYALLLLNSHWGLGFPILNFVLIVTLLALYPNLRSQKQSLFYLLVSFAFSLFIPFRAFELGRVLDFLLVFGLNSLAVATINSKGTLTFKSVLYIPLGILLRAMAEVGYWIDRLLSFYSTHEPNRRAEGRLTFGHGLRGALISLPFIGLFIILLSLADPLFEKAIVDLFDLIPEISLNADILRSGLELVLAFSIISSLLRPISWRGDEFDISIVGRYKTELTIVAILLSVILALFLLVQLNYLFAGEALLKDLGLTHSEYTRRGFGELVLISAISLALVSLLLSKTGETFLPTNLISGTFLTEIAFVLISATRRVYLYQDVFGFTQRRLLGFLFAVWLATLLAIFFAKLFRKIKERQVVDSILLNTLSILFFMNIVNIDYMVGVVKKPNLGYGIDYSYIAALSPDAWPAWDDSIKYFETTENCGW